MNYVEYDEKMLQSFEYETTINSDGNILGICELGKATIEMLNDKNNYSSFKDSWIKTPQGSFYIYNVEPVQERINIKLECYDIKYKLDTLYDSSKHIFPCTLKEWRNSIFNECGVTYDDSDFPNSNLILEKEPPLDNGISNRNVIALVAQAGASFVVTDSNDKFYFKWFDNTIYEANDWIELTTEKEATKPINYIVLGRGDVEDNYYYPLVKPTNTVEFRIDNNYILDPQDTTSNIDLRESTIIPIYGQINGLSFILYTMRTQFISNKLSINLGNKIKYKDIWGNELTSYVMTKKIKWLSGDLKKSDNYEITLSASEIKESSTKISYNKDLKQEIIEISRKTDKNAGKIEDMISVVDGQNEKISKITQTTDEINSKISDIADITTSGESQQASVSLEKVNESEPIAIKIHPISEDISYLYPSDYLYPADDLYLMNRIIRFTNTDTNEVVDYELPDDLLYYDANNYDEFILNYDSQTCSIIKRVEYDKTTNKNVLKTSEETINYDFPTIALTAGNYTISLPGYSSAYLYVQLMASNIYTTQFATKVEVKSSIKQTADAINLEVSKKVGKNEVISSINLTSEAATIQASKVNISGVISAINNNTSTTINGNKITTGSITASQIKAGAITADKINVTNLSSVSSNLGNISGGNLNIGDGKFLVTNDGVLTATSGTIGGWTLSENTLKNSSGKGTTALNSNGRLSFSNGSYFFGVGNGSEHPVASSLSSHSVNYWTNLSVSGKTNSSTWIGGSGIYGSYLSLLCAQGQSIAIGRASGTGDATSINPNGSLRYSSTTGDWTIRTDDGGIYLRSVSGGLNIYGSYDNNTKYHAGRSGKFPYQHGYLYFVNGIFVGRGTS